VSLVGGEGEVDLVALATKVAGQAAAGEQVEAYVSRGSQVSVRVHGGEVEAFTSSTSQAIGVRVVVDGRQGFASAGSLDDDVVAEVLADARDNAGFGEPDDANGLAEPDGVPFVEQDRWREALFADPVDAKIQRALQLEAAVLGGDPRITGVRSASYGDSHGEAALASSTGITAHSRATRCSASVTALAEDGGETQTGGGFDGGREPSELDLEAVAADAVERSTRLLGATQPPSRRLTIVLEPRIAATLLGIVAGTLTGDRVLKGRSPFGDRLGQEIAASALTLVDDPTDSRSIAAHAHDGEGLACRRNVLVADGVADRFLYDTWAARKAGTTSTGSAVRGVRSTPGVGVHALQVVPGPRSAEALLADVEDGLFVASFTGLHSGVNAISGDFSVGADGLVIRDGQLAEPVREITLASTIQRLLLGIREVGADLEWLPGGTGSATLVIDDVSMSGA
jgi:PmbA protein